MTKKSKPGKPRADEKTPLMVIIGIAAIAVMLVWVLIQINQPAKTIPQAMGPDVSIPRGVTAEGFPTLGASDAPLVMTLYEDFGCPNCDRFFKEVEPLFLENYVKTGKVRLVIYTLAIINHSSQPGAEAAYCMADQDLFWEMRDLLFTNQGVVGFTRENFLTWGKAAGADIAQLTNCLDSSSHRSNITQQSQEAFTFGIQGTPTLEINGQRYPGLRAFDSTDPAQLGLKQILDAALSEGK